MDAVNVGSSGLFRQILELYYDFEFETLKPTMNHRIQNATLSDASSLL